ncbi:hypothetical protein [Acetivibrio sp. MSJd-27]|uniref:hypothetical protein n=1 Tax=Acetivibrio sp. MSJd-27 TaxID=2841523 RepID=UPI001C121969|nr:hypothetical protein [Acetivibrio sp. MSJd-27]MBU5449184.1 hypothetical protein [Acetivibrio sp. MSJd-27]
MTEEEARRLEYEEMRKSRPDLTYEEFKKEMGLDAELGWDGNLAGPDNPPREYNLDPNQGGLGAAVVKPGSASNQGGQNTAKPENDYPLLPDNSWMDIGKQEQKTEAIRQETGGITENREEPYPLLVEAPVKLHDNGIEETSAKKTKETKKSDYPLLPDNSWMDIGKQEQKTEEIRREANAYRNEHEGENRMPMWGDSTEKKLVSETYSLSKDENLTDKQRKQIAEALPYLSEKLKEDIIKNGGYGAVLNPSFKDRMTFELGENSVNGLNARLRQALDMTTKRTAVARGALSNLSLGIYDEFENYGSKNGATFGMTKSSKDIAKQQHPNYYGAGYLAGEAALYKGLGTAAKSVKGLSKINNPFLRDFTANAIGDTAVNAGEFVADVAGGKKASQAASDFAKNEGFDLGLNALMGAATNFKGVKNLFGRKALNQDQYRYYRNNVDSHIDKRMQELMDLPEFKKLSPGEQAAYLAQMKKAAREEVYDAARKDLTKDAAEGIMDLPDAIGNLKIIDGKVGGKVPVEEFQTIRKASIKNPEANSMTLGKYTNDSDSYIAKAGKESSYFDMGGDWNKIQDKYGLSESDMFEYFNKPALDDAIASGKTIRFSHDPRKGKGFLKAEWKYLKSILNVTDKNLVYEGGFWYVK